jgi:chromosome segregation protein smc2
MQNIIVDKEEDAKEIIKFLEEKKAGKATFLPLSKFNNNNSNNSVEYENYKNGIISKLKDIREVEKYVYFPKDIVKVNEKYLGIISVFLDKTLIVDNIDIAISVTKKIKGIKVVTLNGELFASTGSITGGYSKKVSNILGRKEEIAKLEKEIVTLERKAEEISNEFENKKAEYILKEKEHSNILNEIYEEKLKIAVKEKEINALREKVEEISEKIKNINSEIENITKESNEILTNKSIIEEVKEKLVEELEKMNDERLKLKENLNDEDTSSKIEEITENIMNVKISIASFEESENSIIEILERITSEEKELEERREKRNAELLEYEKENINLGQRIEENTSDINKIEEENIEIKELQNEIRKEKEEKQNIIKLLNKKIEENDKKIETNIPAKLSKEQEMFKIELEEENYIENMWNEYQITLNNIDIAEYEEYYIEKGLQTRDIEGNIMSFDIIKAKKMLRDLKSSIKDLGEVDTSIIKEYLNTKERYDYLLNQREDLESSKKSLEKIIKEIAFAMEEQFVSRMDIINKNFKEIFVTLFGGRKC